MEVCVVIGETMDRGMNATTPLNGRKGCFKSSKVDRNFNQRQIQVRKRRIKFMGERNVSKLTKKWSFTNSRVYKSTKAATSSIRFKIAEILANGYCKSRKQLDR